MCLAKALNTKRERERLKSRKKQKQKQKKNHSNKKKLLKEGIWFDFEQREQERVSDLKKWRRRREGRWWTLRTLTGRSSARGNWNGYSLTSFRFVSILFFHFFFLNSIDLQVKALTAFNFVCPNLLFLLRNLWTFFTRSKVYILWIESWLQDLLVTCSCVCVTALLETLFIEIWTIALLFFPIILN